MSELLNPGIVSLASLALSVVLLLVGLLLWFFVNRASSRSNEQIELLQSLLDQQSGKMRCCAVSVKPMRRTKKRLLNLQRMIRRKTTTISFVSLPNVKFEEQVCTSRARL